MGFLHRHEDAAGNRYQMRQKVLAIGDDFWIENEHGEHVFKVNGKALRARETFILERPTGEELYKIQKKASAYPRHDESRARRKGRGDDQEGADHAVP